MLKEQHRINTFYFFFFNDTATTEIYTLSYTTLFRSPSTRSGRGRRVVCDCGVYIGLPCSYSGDRKSTRLNSSHSQISYAVFCLKKNRNPHPHYTTTNIRTLRHHHRRNIHVPVRQTFQ